ncbi:MAG TPA: hypothetical protein VLU25_05740 [Acidobacteriota bacterium]|nr:hypothetical protein [Acidobacteriota bacterium]
MGGSGLPRSCCFQACGTPSRKARETLLSNSGLLVSKGKRKAEFYHLSFQEYLAAQRIFGLSREGFARLFQQRSQVSQWANTLSFLFAEILSQPSTEAKAGKLLKRLIEETDSKDLAMLSVIGDCHEIMENRGKSLPEALTGQLREKLRKAVECGEGPLEQRLEVGLALGRVGDPRVIDDLRDHDSEEAWVCVPAGVYKVGEGKGIHEFEVERDLMFFALPGHQQPVSEVC